ncbi:MAG: carboxypeptidase regulatory-like domain-containing protein, partial [Planctomycetes bacterium]|nr:carboxypeptidase regulatory-like domain-containing protein [Planctomycetota bacterium]
ARITGVVTDAAGRPVVGAEVRARLKYSYLIIPPPLVGRTDEEGKFDLGDDPQEWSTLYIDVLPPPGYRSVRGARRGPYELPLSFVLPPGVDVTGRLVAAEGVPLGGLELLAESMLDGAEPSRVHVTTQDDGTFRIAGVPEAWTATLQLDLDELAKRGLRPESALEPVRAGQSGVEIRLAAGGSIRGRVRGELPTDEALVVRAWPHDVTARGSRAADVDAGGAFELNALPPGPHALELWLNGENESLLLGVVDAEMGGEDVVFEMPKLGMVRVELPADAEDWWADGVSTTSHHRALEVWGLTGPVAAIRVVQDASYSLKVYSGSWPGNTLAIARVSDGESFRQPFRSELDLRVRFVGGRLPANATLLARHVETGLESVFDGRPWSTAEVPDGAYDVVLVGSARSETVVARGLRPTGAWHEVRLP